MAHGHATTTQHLRQWQEAALHAYFARRHQDFTVTATPGAGKTTFALTVAARLMATRDITRLIVVTPTDHLRRQWGEAAAAAGIRLESKPGNDTRLPPDVAGYVTTYAQVASRPVLHERRATAIHRTLVVFDEIHHAGDGLTWGEAVLDAFGYAERRLCLTGTPFRTSTTERIPFVTYQDDGEGGLRSVADFAYPYEAALADGVVRPVVFAAYSGIARWQDSAGRALAADLQEPGSARQEHAAWRAVLNPRGPWVRHVIAAAAERIAIQHASGVPDAACLVLASDHEQARAYAAVVKNVTGREPALVLSDDTAASDRIAAFDQGGGDFIVAVRMVSEGVDIRRLTTLVWLTSHRTPLFFAQAVGRVVRARHPGETATVFLPSVRPLLRLAAEVEQVRDHVLAARPDSGDNHLDGDISFDGSDPGSDPNVDDTVRRGTDVDGEGSDARLVTAMVGGQAIAADTLTELTPDDEAYLGIPGLLDPEQVAMLLAQRAANQRPTHTSSSAPATVTLDGAALRKEIVSLVNRWAFREGISMAEAHTMLRRQVPGPRNAEASVSVLANRRDWLLARSM